MSQIFGVSGEWSEERFSGAGQTDVRGMGIELTGCRPAYDDSSSSGTTGQLELRLARGFSSMTFDAFQTNDSPSSDESLVIEVLAGGEQVDIRRIPFDQLQPFEVSVAGKNAIKIRAYLDSRSGCNYNTSASIAVTNLKVS